MTAPQGTCAWCGTPVTLTQPNQAYCSRSHKERARQKRRAEEDQARHNAGRAAETCRAKVAYPSRAKAEGVLSWLRNQVGIGVQSAYECPVCRQWHLTSWPEPPAVEGWRRELRDWFRATA